MSNTPLAVMKTHQFIPGVYTVSELLPYEMEDNGDTVYIRYTDGTVLTRLHPRPVRKEAKDLIIKKSIVTENGATTTRYEKAYDLWSNRATASYIPICRPFKEDGSTVW